MAPRLCGDFWFPSSLGVLARRGTTLPLKGSATRDVQKACAGSVKEKALGIFKGATMLRLLNKVVIVTGGANGIGRVYTAHLCSEGARVLIADIDIDSAIAVAETINKSLGREVAVACQVNVTSEADTQRMAETAVQHFGQIDVLLNNAGTYPHVAFEDIDYEAWRKVIAVNLDSVFLCTKVVLPIMKAQGFGKIINVATNLVWVGLPGMVHYIAAKSGI